MDFLNNSLFSRLSPSPSPTPETKKTVKGTPSVISEYVYNDIQLVKQQIKTFNGKTGIFQSNSFYYKIFKLIENNQSSELNNLKCKYKHNFTNDYYKNLLQLYKRFLEELDDFFMILQNNYHNGLVKDRSRKNSMGSRNSDNKDEEAPEELIDPLTYELFKDPVITPSGITYEKAIILEHLNKNGQFDPLTRNSLHPNDLYPNLAIKNSVNTFINDLV